MQHGELPVKKEQATAGVLYSGAQVSTDAFLVIFISYVTRLNVTSLEVKNLLQHTKVEQKLDPLKHMFL